MGRPRHYDLDELLGHARTIWLERGVDGLTIRALSAASGASNGAVYHAFGSRAGLLAGVWSQEAGRFLAFQRDRVREARLDGDATAALVAAALAPATYATDDADGARLLLAVTADDLLAADPGVPARTRLLELQQELGALLADLASVLWGRRDRTAITVVRHCVVTLPGALLLNAEEHTDPLAAYSLEHAVRGIASLSPPQPSPV
ncbi:TetR/AcrR family transcriptional regulator [Nocardioides albus]|uniref:AcrR family transcriptional regulator n=1 Tax=Nocardioides albus TaxID=1841 RepID=A0A7W5A1T0_9ACTN|nr:TetR/AcrR family transcriptional regulator [Nocardioides albus]MBB3087764.1 AcrR family transcriptional regulator [Nocardioides albus]GGU20134.1 putative transcriptional regulator, TetR [Nocardioides albus]